MITFKALGTFRVLPNGVLVLLICRRSSGHSLIEASRFRVFDYIWDTSSWNAPARPRPGPSPNQRRSLFFAETLVLGPLVTNVVFAPVKLSEESWLSLW
ncbi:hypothetical protein BKA58DRAFT_390661 [Alternaria rosae]|uniref:uncharacterized protein n=1 Tax=Alternaria rosae TaxID=1187941 RepID=UPI001E8E1D65|nr:uncharacterized protein BKA58DRAFT_390661 [Alternaria rosae]KAH6864707.1 hypothetical protein BKA58DRAFT_390661 [Alternaria rosae]